jgi:phosphate transport system permease protein
MTATSATPAARRPGPARLTGEARLAQLAKAKAARKRKDRVVELILLAAACVSVFTTLAIVYILVKESIAFFDAVPLSAFVSDTQWTPLFDDAHFGIRVLLAGTVSSTLVALSIAIPLGTIIAIYLSEFASYRVREVLKPLLELLSGVPSIIYGFFALLVVTPIIQKIYPGLPTFNILSAGIVMGIMIIPYVSSLSEDAMRAVPMSLREGAYAMGSTRFQTATRVVLPAALSGIASAYILGISRAVGETMILAVAAGMQPNLTLNPLEPAATVTSFIVQVALGDLPHGSVGYQTIFAAGLTLMLLTLMFNLLGYWLRRRFREVY